MVTPSYSATATERVLPRLALDFTTGVLDPRVTVTRALNTATRTNASGILEIVNANLPRFDYDPSTLTCKGLLIEESRANLLLNSLIDGSNLATQSVTLSATAYTLSFYGTGSIVISGGHSATVTGSGAYPTRKTYTFTPSAGSSTFTVSGTVQYAQLETGAFATSYIPTTTTSLTRNRDSVFISGTNFSSWYNQDEGTFVFEATAASGLRGGAQGLFSLNNGTTANVMNGARTNTGVLRINSTGSPAGDISSVAAIANLSTIKAAFGYEVNNWGLSLNAATPVIDTAAVVLPVTRLGIGSLDGLFDADAMWDGQIRKIQYYPFRLSNAELQAFSANP